MAKKNESEKQEEKIISPLEQIEAFLAADENKELHFNEVKETNYVVSSGSLTLDIKMGGGIRPGIVRFCGITEGGKTSCSLSFAREFQKTVKNSFVIYFKSEGRLSQDMIERSGIDTDPKKFKIIKSNVYELVAQMIEEQIKNNPTDTKYLFIIDSMDALSLKEDLAKTFGESQKVAGAALLTSLFLKRLALAISSCGHCCFLISQVRAQVQIDPYASKVGKNTGIVNSTGGHASLHYPDWILEFQERYKDDIIREGDSEDKNAEIIGHWCKLQFKKSPNEKSQSFVRYPIKYGRTGGKSVWIEKEVGDLLLAFGYVVKKGGWYYFPQEVTSKVKKETGIEMPEKIQGWAKVFSYLEENEKLMSYFYEELKAGLKEKV